MATEPKTPEQFASDVRDFLEHLRQERGLAPNTIAAYAADIAQLLDFLYACGCDDWQVPKSDIANYREMLIARGYASSTQSRKMASLRALYRYLTANGRVDDNPTDGMQSSWRRLPPPQVLTTSDVDRLIDAAMTGPGEFAPQRERAILELLYATGVQATEVIRLDLADIDLTEASVRCGRGLRSQRDQPIGPRVVQALRSWIYGQRRTVAGPDQRALFVNQRGERLTRQGIWLILKRLARAAGIKKQVSPRTLRHTFATNVASNLDSLTAVRERLGHVSGSASAMYRQMARKNPRTGDRLKGS